ncbi:hypothetical protein [Thermomonospora amylolytica]|uniref:hypothetical protein n=1 Tax=Thermomonospora amylolytica TaxID=1411117 RepID=UPI000E6BD731|nr:hypothetical protein [Thermomonospora amylolytica]
MAAEEPAEGGLADRIREAVTIRPGDTLVIRLDPRINPAQFGELAEQIKTELPDVKLLLLGGGVEQIARIDRQED